MDSATEAAHSAAIESNADFTSYETCVAGSLDSSPATGSEPHTSMPIESDWAPIMEFSSVDIFQHSPLGDVLNSLRSLSLLGGPWPNYVRLEWEADDEEIRHPPTTHLIATVDDLTNMLDVGSKDIDGMDDDAGEEQEPPPTGRWTATSSHDIYIWWIHPKKTMTRNGRMQRRIVPSRSNQSDGVGAAPNPASAKTAITAQEKIIPRSTREETTTTWTQ